MKIAVDTAKKKAGLLNFILDEKEIRNKPIHTIRTPKKPKKFIELFKNIMLIITISSEEPPLAIG